MVVFWEVVFVFMYYYVQAEMCGRIAGVVFF
jgi:hypothetical protein